MRTCNNDCHKTETFFVIGLLTGLDVAISNQNDAITVSETPSIAELDYNA